MAALETGLNPEETIEIEPNPPSRPKAL